MIGTDRIEVHLVDLAEVRAVAGDALADLPADELAAAGRHRGAARRTQAATSRLLLRAVLARATGVAPGAVPIAVDQWGRPGLTGGAPGGHDVNVSHDRGLVALVLGRGFCGIDVEDAPETELREVAGRFCGAGEQPASARQRWAAKESAAKAIGRGLRAGLRSIRFAGDPAAGWSPVTWRDRALALRTRAVDLGTRHLAVTARLAGPPSVAVHAWSPQRAGGRWLLAESAGLAADRRVLATELSTGWGQ